MRSRIRRHPVLILGIALAALGVVAAGAVVRGQRRAEAAYARDLEEARRALSRGALNVARRGLDRLVDRWPGRGEPLLLLGQCAERAGDVAAARAAWEAVPPHDPSYVAAVESEGMLMINAGQFAPAEEALLRGLEAAPASSRSPILRALARLLRLQGRFDDVSEVLIAAWPGASDPGELLKELWQNDTEPIPAEGWKLLLDRADPQDDRVWLGRARLALRMGRLDDARPLLNRCAQIRPKDLTVRRARLELSREALDPDRFWEEAAQIPAPSLSPGSVALLRCWLAERSGHHATEDRGLQKLLALQPANTTALERLAVLAAERGNLAEARDHQRAKARIDAARDAIHKLVVREASFRSNAALLARQCTILGREFDARAWSLIAAEQSAEAPSTGSDPQLDDDRASCLAESERALERFRRSCAYEATSPSLADLLADLRAGFPPRGPGGLASATSPDRPTSDVQFVDDAATAGLNFVFENGRTPSQFLPETLSGGVGLIDFDEDGWLDVYCVQGGVIDIAPGAEGRDERTAGDRLFRNRRDGTFEDATEASGVARLTRHLGYGMGIAVGDYDNDGHRDLFLTRLRRYALLRNRGDGTFEDATKAVGLDGPRESPTSAAFADLDGDGDLDLYVCHYIRWDPDHLQTCRDEAGHSLYCDPAKYEAAPDHVFRNDGGRFVDVTREAGFTDPDGRGLGVVAADLDGDRRVDLFVANDGTANFLFHNQGGFRFEETGHLSGAAGNAEGGFRAGMGVLAADLDDDGRLDLLVNNLYGEGSTLYRNLGNLLFADRSATSGLLTQTRYLTGFGVAAFDPSNDGRLFVAAANGHINDSRPLYPYAMPCRLYEVAAGRFRDASSRAGNVWERPRLGRGLACGDLDNDGRVDLVVVSQNEPLVYLHNRTARAGHFLTLELQGNASNRDGIGAELVVEAGGRRRTAWRMGGGSYLSAHDARLHIGLGTSDRAGSVEVRWPSGRVDRWTDLAADRGYRLREGAAAPGILRGFAGPERASGPASR